MARVPSRVAATLWLPLAFACSWAGAAAAQPRLERVVIVMRHGVRPPTKAMALPLGYTRRAWPSWPVPPGWLTPHGEQAIARLADFDAMRYGALLPAGCAATGQLRMIADTDERTLRTAQAYAARLRRGCTIAVENAGPGRRDPRFSPLDVASGLDPDAALASARADLPAGGVAALDTEYAGLLASAGTILDCCTDPACPDRSPCHLADQPTRLEASGGRVRITGQLAIAASFAQTLLLEYADGKAMAEVGWGQVSPAQIAALSKLHALEFALTARPRTIAAAGARPLLGEIDAALRNDAGPRVTVMVGHDTNLAYLGGALGVHWQASGFAADDPSPGGGLVFEGWRDDAGHRWVRLRYRSQSLDELRNLSPMMPADVQAVAMTACGDGHTCGAEEFHTLAGKAGQ